MEYVNWYAPEWPESLRGHRNPDVSVRPKGVIEKCTFCHHRLQNAREEARREGRQLREEYYQPACVEVCPSREITFGDLDNPSHHVYSLSQDPRPSRLMGDPCTPANACYPSELQ